jgi:hypothetical protein
MPLVRPATGVKGLDESGVRRIELAWVGISLALRLGSQRHGADQEGIQQVAEHGMHGILGHAVPLGLQVLMQTVDAEARRRVA